MKGSWARTTILQFERVYDDRFAPKHGFWRPVIRNVADRFLDCGDLRHGFARIRCENLECSGPRLRYFPTTTRIGYIWIEFFPPAFFGLGCRESLQACGIFVVAPGRPWREVCPVTLSRILPDTGWPPSSFVESQ